MSSFRACLSISTPKYTILIGYFMHACEKKKMFNERGKPRVSERHIEVKI